MIRAEVPVDGEESSTNQDEQDAAAEPRHRRGNVAHSFRAALGREPIVAMRKIDHQQARQEQKHIKASGETRIIHTALLGFLLGSGEAALEMRQRNWRRVCRGSPCVSCGNPRNWKFPAKANST